MADHAAELDTSIEIVTPENIAFQYRVAGPFRRLPAYLIDLIIRLVAVVVGIYVLMLLFETLGLGEAGRGAGLVLWFAVAWFYGGLFETYWNGQTPGKRMMHIRVVSADGQPIAGWQAVLRNVLRFIDGQPLFSYQVGLIAASLNRRFQRLGDLVCGTMVVVEERQRLDGVMRVGDPEVLEMAALLPPNFQPSRTLARTLAAYVMRRVYFSVGRRMEIAQHVAEPLCQRFRLPPQINPDLLLCALYHRVFVHETEVQPVRGSSPFGKMGTGSEPVGAGFGRRGSGEVPVPIFPDAPRDDYAVQETPPEPPIPAFPPAWRQRRR
jgi:uncharacterized RDD family membrane protein YckC